MNRKPAALVARWNKDLSISLYCRGKKVFNTGKGRAASKENVAAFLEGWFGGHPQKIRWVYA